MQADLFLLDDVRKAYSLRNYFIKIYLEKYGKEVDIWKKKEYNPFTVNRQIIPIIVKKGELKC